MALAYARRNEGAVSGSVCSDQVASVGSCGNQIINKFSLTTLKLIFIGSNIILVLYFEFGFIFVHIFKC